MHKVEILADKNIFKTASASVSGKSHLRDGIKIQGENTYEKDKL